MTHTLRKYLSNRGSALFMVLSTMTALLIAVMAMYFSVVSSRSVQYAVFNQEQSYQSAISLQNAMTADLTQTGPMKDVLNTLVSSSFDVGDKISTNGNDFLAFGGTNSDENNVGAYDVTITRVDDEVVSGKTCKTFDIATTVSVNGVMDTVHMYIHVIPSDDATYPASSDIFASTGYVPNNSFLSTGMFYTKSTFDNEFTVIGEGSGGSLTISDLFCGGSMEVNWIGAFPDKPVTWVVRDTMYYNVNQALELGPSDSQRGELYIGKDFVLAKGKWIDFKNMDVYCFGDFYMYDGGGINWSNSSLHVDGDIYYGSGSVPSELECNGKVIKTTDGSELSGVSTWADEDANAKLKFIEEKTQSHEFQKWTVDPSKFNGTKTEICFNTSDADGTDSYGRVVPAYTYTCELKWNGTGSEQYADITDVRDLGTKNNADGKYYTILIDTGDDSKNIYYLRLNGIRDWDGDAHHKKETFSWYPSTAYNVDGRFSMDQGRVAVIFKGAGSVVVTIDEGVTYVASDQEVIMHEGWFRILGGTVNADGSYKCPSTYSHDEIEKYIHTKCDGDCTYTVKTSTAKCPTCGEYLTNIVCENHAYDNNVCTNPDCEAKNEPQKNESGNYVGLCENRIDKSKVTAAGYSVIPTVNFFIVSCDESAEIYVSDFITSSGSTGTVKDNRFFGFIYAPYMTYKGMGSSGSGTRFCGGMVVSDYILKDSYEYINCYPSYMPEQLGASSGKLAHADKGWKVVLGRN